MSLVTSAGGGGGGSFPTRGPQAQGQRQRLPPPPPLPVTVTVRDLHSTSLPANILGSQLFLSITPSELTSRLPETEAKETRTVEGHYPRVPSLRIRLLAKCSVIPQCVPVALSRSLVDMRRTANSLSCWKPAGSRFPAEVPKKRHPAL